MTAGSLGFPKLNVGAGILVSFCDDTPKPPELGAFEAAPKPKGVVD